MGGPEIHSNEGVVSLYFVLFQGDTEELSLEEVNVRPRQNPFLPKARLPFLHTEVNHFCKHNCVYQYVFEEFLCFMCICLALSVLLGVTWIYYYV